MSIAHFVLALTLILLACTKQTLKGVSSENLAQPSEPEPNAVIGKGTEWQIAGYTLKDEGNQGWFFLDKDRKKVYCIEASAGQRSLLFPSRSEPVKGSFPDSDPVVRLRGTEKVLVIVFQEINNNQFSYRIVCVEPDVCELTQITSEQSKMELNRLEDGTVRLQSVIVDCFNDFGQYSVNPRLVIEWDGKQLCPAKQAAPDEVELAEICSGIRWEFQRWKPIDPSCAQPIAKAPPRLAEAVLQLFYSGHSKTAKILYDKSWIGTSKDKSRYWKFLLSILRRAEHWKEVRILNRL